MSNTDKKELYGWVFTYNPHTGNYRCATGADVNFLFSLPEAYFLRSKNSQTLEELIIKCKGEKDKVQKLIR